MFVFVTLACLRWLKNGGEEDHFCEENDSWIFDETWSRDLETSSGGARGESERTERMSWREYILIPNRIHARPSLEKLALMGRVKYSANLQNFGIELSISIMGKLALILHLDAIFFFLRKFSSKLNKVEQIQHNMTKLKKAGSGAMSKNEMDFTRAYSHQNRRKFQRKQSLSP